jgi:prepilin-type N-terminal cleavage/methylation domain-containing protein
MFSKIRKQSEGFTIIEVLIVLAIAGLIMLVVFLAVPNLQRNSRNSQRRSDVSSILGAVQEVMNNNNGSISSITSSAVNGAVGTLAYYDLSVSGNLTIRSSGTTNTTTTDTIIIQTGAKCNGADPTTTGANSRQLAILYSVEAGGGGATRVCTGS